MSSYSSWAAAYNFLGGLGGRFKTLSLILYILLFVSFGAYSLPKFVPRLHALLRAGSQRRRTDDTKLAEDYAGTTTDEETGKHSATGAKWFVLKLMLLPWRHRLPHKRLAPPPLADRGLQVLHDDVNAAFDVVAVHGLGANPDYAWVWNPKNNPPGSGGYPSEWFNWLKQLLPTELSCRVMTFNYDSKWFMDAPQQRLSSISDNLIRSLQAKREEDDKTRDRPLIWIGHSFGGNLIEQAIVTATRQNSHHLSLAQSTAGVVFLGTPHRGSPAATWGLLITSLAPPGFTTEDRILRELDVHSATLVDRLRDFSMWLFSESVPVLCCYETLTTDYSARAGALGSLVPFKQLVVPELSACIDGYRPMALHKDHLKINKFYGPDDPSFKAVYAWIKRVAKDEHVLSRRRHPVAIPTNETATSGNLRKCLQEMRVTNPQDIVSEIQTQKGKRVEQTCEWILKREEFTAWGAGEASRVLWLLGSPGIGKTMMSIFLAGILKEKVQKSPDQSFAYFFFDDKIQNRRTPIAMLRSLIWQVLLQRNCLFRHMESDFENHTSANRFSDLFDNFSTLWRIFTNMVQDEDAGEVFILLDAMDECDASKRNPLLFGIKDLLQVGSTSGGRLKLLITSRPGIGDIEAILKDVGVSLWLDSAKINDDLSVYIDTKVTELARLKGYKHDLEARVKDAFKAQSGGTFLWVSLMVAELGRDDVLLHQVDNRLKTLPSGLDDIYASILDRIPASLQDVAQFILRCMTAAKRPLSPVEIQTAFATSNAATTITLPEDVGIYDDIFSACSSILYKSDLGEFLGMSTTVINFCHQSVKDFLSRAEDSQGDNKWYHSPVDKAHLVLFHCCWRYLVAAYSELDGPPEFLGLDRTILPEIGIKDDLPQYAISTSGTFEFMQFRIGNRSSSKEPREYEFLGYASHHWEDHAMASYPSMLSGLEIDVRSAPSLCGAWLLRAAGQGSLHVLEALIKRGASVNVAGNMNNTPLIEAAKHGQQATAQFLLETARVDADKSDTYGRTPFSHAAGSGHEAILRLLLATGKVDVDKEDTYGWTPFAYAVESGREAILQLLLTTGKVDADKPEKQGRTPFSYATGSGREATLRLLITTGKVDVDKPDNDGRTPFSYAAEAGYEAILQLLLATGKVDIDKPDNKGQTPFLYAAGSGHEAILGLLLATGKVNPDRPNSDGRTALLWAALAGRGPTVRFLIQNGVDMNKKDSKGRTPLALAAQGSEKKAVKLLLLHGAHIDLGDNDGQTPLFWAVRNGRRSVVEILMNHGADVNAKAIDGRTPLDVAIEHGDEEMIELLRRHME
ncbi:hypothetical protein B0T19DRAFT_296963 [Cercophora scortea]|uniref:NACHT domain-containing protein n=1 Tax=Cercophora scortea TaxID=314031 RepID=A0AAE0M4M5_9PEZI|nr:hypothetical protein B0T19DRAFT_296963 [Cercophora scortea]